MYFFFFPIRRRHTSGALVTGVQTCALPIYDPAGQGRHCSQEKEMHRLISCAAALAVLTLTAAGEPPTRTPMAEAALQKALAGRTRSEERRVGNECVSTCRSR